MTAVKKEYAEAGRAVADCPLTTTRLTFPDGTTRYVLVPKGYDIQLRWVRFKTAMGKTATPDAFMVVLHEEAIVDADVGVDVDMQLS